MGTLTGVAVSIGLGTLQINAGLASLFGISESALSQILIIAAVTIVASVSVALGLDRGIKVLSNTNILLAIGLLVFVLVSGPTVMLLRGTIEWFGVYMQELPGLMFWNDTLDDLAALGMRTGWGDDWLRIGPAKLFQDGSGGGRTAAMSVDYVNDPGNRGITIYGQDGLNQRFRRAHAAGLTHRDLTSENVLVDGSGAVWLLGWESGEVASTELSRRLDLAQVLALLGVVAGPERALASASRALTREQMAAIAP